MSQTIEIDQQKAIETAFHGYLIHDDKLWKKVSVFSKLEDIPNINENQLRVVTSVNVLLFEKWRDK